jgi:hydantoinase/carbamoylase family amidase
MRSVGLCPERLSDAALDPADIAAVVELHIDQGRTLADADCPVGVITSITGSNRMRLTLQGQADHSGATPMDQRRDALTGAAEIVLSIERIAREGPPSLVGTVGNLEVQPGSISVVPGTAILGVDLRDVDARGLETASESVRRSAADVAARRNLTCRIDPIRAVAPVALSPRVQATLREAASAAGLDAIEMPSTSGHDAASFADRADVGMLFVRNQSGRSHTVEEAATWDDALSGARILSLTLAQLAVASADTCLVS